MRSTSTPKSMDSFLDVSSRFTAYDILGQLRSGLMYALALTASILSIYEIRYAKVSTNTGAATLVSADYSVAFSFVVNHNHRVHSAGSSAECEPHPASHRIIWNAVIFHSSIGSGIEAVEKPRGN